MTPISKSKNWGQRLDKRAGDITSYLGTPDIWNAQGGVLIATTKEKQQKQQQTVALKFWFNANWFWHRLVNFGGRSTHIHTHTHTLRQSQVESLCNKYFCLFLLGKELREVDPRYSLVKQIKSALERNQAEAGATKSVASRKTAINSWRFFLGRKWSWRIFTPLRRNCCAIRYVNLQLQQQLCCNCRAT